MRYIDPKQADRCGCARERQADHHDGVRSEPRD